MYFLNIFSKRGTTDNFLIKRKRDFFFFILATWGQNIVVVLELTGGPHLVLQRLLSGSGQGQRVFERLQLRQLFPQDVHGDLQSGDRRRRVDAGPSAAARAVTLTTGVSPADS